MVVDAEGQRKRTTPLFGGVNGGSALKKDLTGPTQLGMSGNATSQNGASGESDVLFQRAIENNVLRFSSRVY